MKIKIHESCVKLWLSARDTYDWAHQPGESWPCSTLSDKRLFAEFDRNGLVDLAINGRSTNCDVTELNAITSDFLRGRLPVDHPAWFVAVGQFSNERTLP
jgi:hypothetical protein